MRLPVVVESYRRGHVHDSAQELGLLQIRHGRIPGLELGGLLPGIKVNTSATDFAPLSQLQLQKFKGDTWERFGEILNGDVGG